MQDCVFCKIIKGEIPTEFVYKDINIVVFKSNAPQATYHFLVVPIKHIINFTKLGPEDGEIWKEMVEVAQKLIADNNLESKGFRVIMNGGKAAEVHHLHMHVMGDIDTERPN